MTTEADPDYVRKLEAALFEYVEKYGLTPSVRDLFKKPTGDPKVLTDTVSSKVGQGFGIKRSSRCGGQPFLKENQNGSTATPTRGNCGRLRSSSERTWDVPM